MKAILTGKIKFSIKERVNASKKNTKVDGLLKSQAYDPE